MCRCINDKDTEAINLCNFIFGFHKVYFQKLIGILILFPTF